MLQGIAHRIIGKYFLSCNLCPRQDTVYRNDYQVAIQYFLSCGWTEQDFSDGWGIMVVCPDCFHKLKEKEKKNVK